MRRHMQQQHQQKLALSAHHVDQPTCSAQVRATYVAIAVPPAAAPDQ
jgi:hypothetical protein